MAHFLQIIVVVIQAMVLLLRYLVLIQSTVHRVQLLFLRPFPFDASLYLSTEN
jgi:hypothetical protein